MTRGDILTKSGFARRPESMQPLLQYRELVSSTNDTLSTWVRDGAMHGTAVYAGTQTAGRGRRGRVWHAPPGTNLNLSVAIVGPQFAASMLRLPLAAGVATAEVLRRRSPDVQLKWPNDIVVSRGQNFLKLGGILCEAVTGPTGFQAAIIGIGVNVNGTSEDLSPEVRGRACTLSQLIEKPTDIAELAAEVRLAVVGWAERVAHGEGPHVIAQWRRLDATTGRRVVGDGFEGIANGITDQGHLRVSMADGTTKEVGSGEIRFA